MSDTIYTFVKDRQECGNIEACKFTGDVFRTKDPLIAEKLRKSSTFGKTVREITENIEAPDPSADYVSLKYHELLKLAQDAGMEKTFGKKKEELIAYLEMKAQDGHQ